MIGKFGTNFLINLYSSASSTSVQSNGGLSSMEQGILNFFNLVLQIISYEIDVLLVFFNQTKIWRMIVINFVRQVVNFEKQFDVKCLDQVKIK